MSDPEYGKPAYTVAERRSLRKTKKMWQWIAENDPVEKYKFFRVKGLKMKDYPENGCYCCEEFAKGRDNAINCVGCPLSTRADGDDPGLGCADEGEPYGDWESTGSDDPIEASKHALRLVAQIDNALSRPIQRET